MVLASLLEISMALLSVGENFVAKSEVTQKEAEPRRQRNLSKHVTFDPIVVTFGDGTKSEDNSV
jgi:hypothetical protein